MNIDSLNFSSVLSPYLSGISNFLTQVLQGQRIEDTIGHRDNPEEAEQFDEEIKNTRAVVSMNGNVVSVSIVTSGSAYDKDMDEGHPAPYAGGTGGIVTNPDGSTRPSLVPKQLQGTTDIEEYAEEGSSVWRQNFEKMCSTLLPDLVRDAIDSAKEAIAGLIKPLIVEEIRGAFA